MAFLMIYITHENEAAATEIVKRLVNEKLVACGNCFPMKSMYWWQGAVQNEEEWVSIVKTIPENWALVKTKVQEWHPYDVPCIAKWEVEANESYENWIREAVSD